MRAVTKYNVNAPQTIGLEWKAVSHVDKDLAITPGQVAVVQSTINENVPSFDVYLDLAAASAKVQFDIYDVTNPTNLDRSPFDEDGDALAPVGDAAGTLTGAGAWNRSDGATSNLYAAVDNLQSSTDPIGDPSFLNDWMSLHSASNYYFKDALFIGGNTFLSRANGASTTTPTGRRIAAVRIRALGGYTSFGPPGTVFSGAILYGKLRINGSNYIVDAQTPRVIGDTGGVEISDPSTVQEFTWTWFTNPATGFPWTANDVSRFTGPDNWGLYGRIRGDPGVRFGIFNLQLEVVHTEDRRVSWSRRTFANGPINAGWQRFTNLNLAVAQASTWAKTAGKKYAIVGFLGDTQGHVQWRGIVPKTGTTPDHSSALYPLNPNGSGITSFSSDDTIGTGVSPFGIVFGVSPTLSPDSQPYVDVVQTAVTATTKVQQELQTATTAPFGMVTVLARPHGTIGSVPRVDAPLQLSLRRRSDSALIAGPINVEATELGTTVDGTLQIITRRFDTAPTLTASTQYYVEVTSATGAGRPWWVGVLTSKVTTYELVSYSGTNNRASYGAPLADHIGDDAPVTIQTVPTVLTNVTAGQQTQTLPLGLSGACALTGINYASVAWDASTLGGTFAWYDIERQEGTQFVAIGRLTEESSAAFADFELPRNYTVRYRVRVVRTDGAYSDWSYSNFMEATIGVDDLILTTNFVPDLNVGYLAGDPEREWSFEDRRRLVAIYGQDYKVAFRPSELAGDSFQRTMIVAFDDPQITPGNAGRQLFQPLLNIVDSPLLPYVVLCDGDGNRWYASAQLARANEKHWQGNGHQYLATVQFDQVQGPYAVVTDSSFVAPPTGGTLYGDPGGVYGDAGSTYAT